MESKKSLAAQKIKICHQALKKYKNYKRKTTRGTRQTESKKDRIENKTKKINY
jgi:hypothetical protein